MFKRRFEIRKHYDGSMTIYSTVPTMGVYPDIESLKLDGTDDLKNLLDKINEHLNETAQTEVQE